MGKVHLNVRVQRVKTSKGFYFTVIHLPQLSTHYCKSMPFEYNFTAQISSAMSLEFCQQELKL